MGTTKKLELTVPREASGSRLDIWLAEAIGASSRAVVQSLIDARRVLVDGRTRPKGFRLAGGERVSADPKLPLPPPPGPVSRELQVMWEDEHLMVVDKPAGIVVHPAPGHRGVTLVDLLASRSSGEWTPLVVHRLDKNTSGLMLVAKNERAQRRLRELIRKREVERTYLVLVKGRLASRRGTIDAPIGRDMRSRIRMSTRTAKPRAARTHFSVERSLDGFTLVRARLETGRTHQIRAHFAAIGNPVCGDPEYGGARLPGLDRQFLHSCELRFPHPESGRPVKQSSPLPVDLAAVLGTLVR
jgi:23S rRNA pseudouridine1911/1915/1917 synthase